MLQITPSRGSRALQTTKPGTCSLVVLQNTVTGRPCWVSKTTRINEKEIIKEIFRKRRGLRQRLNDAMDKYGKQAFVIHAIIPDIPLDQLGVRRDAAIIQYHTWEEPFGHNTLPKHLRH